MPRLRDIFEHPAHHKDVSSPFAPICWKLAQVIRVLLAKCTTTLRFPMKDWSSPVAVKESVYEATKGDVVIAPYLPARSPTWHVIGRAASQGGLSPRSKGSR